MVPACPEFGGQFPKLDRLRVSGMSEPVGRDGERLGGWPFCAQSPVFQTNSLDSATKCPEHPFSRLLSCGEKQKPSRNGNSASAGPTLPMPDSNRNGKQQRVNTSIQNPKSHCVVQPSNDLSKKKGNSPALKKPLASFTAVLWLAGFILLLFGTPL